jgi:molybdate/tungstate transport system substrate-binding protein
MMSISKNDSYVPRIIPIFHAGSLMAPFSQVSDAFKIIHPDIEIAQEAGGSATVIRKVTKEKRDCAVIGSADYKLIPRLMFPEFASWYVIFASDEIVIAFTERSLYSDEINTGNWYEILQRDGVKYGRTDPDQDPGGYRALLVWQLAEDYYMAPHLFQKLYGALGDVMKPAGLLTALKSGEISYAFEYAAVAKRNNLHYITLPGQINLSDKQYDGLYSKASVSIRSGNSQEAITMTGEPIFYAVTIPNNFPDQELAVKWVEILLSKEGTRIIEGNGLRMIEPPITNNMEKLPFKLQHYFR